MKFEDVKPGDTITVSFKVGCVYPSSPSVKFNTIMGQGPSTKRTALSTWVEDPDTQLLKIDRPPRPIQVGDIVVGTRVSSNPPYIVVFLDERGGALIENTKTKSRFYEPEFAKYFKRNEE